MSHPLAFHLQLFPEMFHDFAAKFPQVHLVFENRQVLVALLEKTVTPRENRRARLRLELVEQSHPQVEGPSRSRIGIAELVDAPQKIAAALRRERILLARLAPLAGNFFLVNPSFVEKPPQHGIDKVVVQRLLPRHPSGLALELVSVLRSGQ